VLAVVEDDLEEPREGAGVVGRRLRARRRRAVPVVDALDILVDEALRLGEAGLLLDVVAGYVRGVLGLVLEPGGVPAVVEGRFDQPAKDAPGVLRIREASRG
jgi:hypothetical protein